MKTFWLKFIIITIIYGCVSCDSPDQEEEASRPNILFAIADDASFPHMGAYGTEWVNTPAFDRVAENGILFMNAYTPNAKCAPSRASVLTGRNSWQLEEAANHWAFFPQAFQTFMEALGEHEYHVGYTAKGWAPGDPGTINGEKRQLTGPAYNEIKTDPPAEHINNTDYAANFEQFLEDRSADDEPFCFWYGSTEPHRAYEFRAGIEKGGKSLDDIEEIPDFWPDNDTVRTDMLDYAFEIDYFDSHLQKMLSTLEERGELENTLVVVTADNGMPFPRIKGQEYEYSNHLPLAIMWAEGIKNPGRTVDDFVSFIDFAPTFLEVAGIERKNTEMEPITGRSLTEIFNSQESGQVIPERDHVVIGKERHDIGRPNDWGYPVRGIVTDQFLYLHNFKPERWPAGNPETGYLNTDGSPTKTWILDHRTDGDNQRYWELNFGKRPEEEMYRIQDDPSNVENLAIQQEFQGQKEQLRGRLFSILENQDDPRIYGNGVVFDDYTYANEGDRNFYERYMSGEIEKSDAGWVNPGDFEKEPLD